MKKIALIFMLIALGGCNWLNVSHWRDHDFVFTVEFHPSRYYNSQVTFRKTDKSQSLSIDILYHNVDYIEEEDMSKVIIGNSDSLLAAKINKSFRSDTVYFHRMEEVSLSTKVLHQFYSRLQEIDLTEQGDWMKKGIPSPDGITVIFRFQSELGDNLFEFKNPLPGHVEEYQIIQAIFEMMGSSFETKLAKSYVTHLGRYFGIRENMDNL